MENEPAIIYRIGEWEPDVKVIASTPDPMHVVSTAAGCCYGKDDYSPKRVKTCFDSGHLSVFEHVSVTFKLSDISRSCTHQLVRHRLASYSQRSQRYCKIDVNDQNWYVTPPDIWIDDNRYYSYADYMKEAAETYNGFLKNGVRPEDARFILPEATKTEIVVTMNFRELVHFLEVRTSSRAQWEIRKLAEKMASAVSGLGGEWAELIDLAGYSHLTCGNDNRKPERDLIITSERIEAYRFCIENPGKWVVWNGVDNEYVYPFDSFEEADEYLRCNRNLGCTFDKEKIGASWFDTYVDLDDYRDHVTADDTGKFVAAVVKDENASNGAVRYYGKFETVSEAGALRTRYYPSGYSVEVYVICKYGTLVKVKTFAGSGY